MKINFNKIKVLAFDFDLTLVDSSKICISINNIMSKNHGIFFDKIPDKERWGATFKLNSQKAKLLNDTTLSAQEIEDLTLNYAFEHYKDIKICSQESLRKWQARGVSFAIISGNTKKIIEKSLQNKWNRGLVFDPIYETNSGHSKTERLIELMKNLKLNNDEIVYIGDHINDVVAAQKANVGSIAVLTGTLERDDFTPYKPDLIIANLDALNNYWGHNDRT